MFRTLKWFDPAESWWRPTIPPKTPLTVEMYKLYILEIHDKFHPWQGVRMIEQTLPDAPAFSARSVVIRASGALLAFERLALMGLMYLLTALILVNVVTRYSHFPIYWIDESAV